MQSYKHNKYVQSVLVLILAIILFCVYTYIIELPKEKPSVTPWPTLNARIVDLKNNLLVPDDFANSAVVKLGKQHDGLPSQGFLDKLNYGSHTYDDVGNPIRVFTYEIISSNSLLDYWPKGYLTVFIYETANEAKNRYGGNNDVGGFEASFFHWGYPYDWAAGSFLRCRIIGNIYIEGFNSDGLILLSRSIDSRMGYLC
jgi:hypothetical protein